MTAVWSGWAPEVRFQQVEVLSQDQSKVLLKVNALGVGIDILKSMVKWRIEPAWIDVSGTNLTIQQGPNGHLVLNGFTTSPNDTNSSFKLEDFVAWLLSQNKIYLEHINILWKGKDGRIIPFRNTHLKFTQGLLSNELLGAATIPVPPRSTRLQFVLNFKGNPISDNDFKARLYVNLKRVPLGFWIADRIPHFTINQGQADLQVWANWTGKQLQSLQTQFNTNAIALNSSYLLHNLFINHLAGDLEWQRQSQGWLTAGTTDLTLNDNKWPDLAFKLQQVSDTTQTQYHLHVNTLNLGLVDQLLTNINLLSEKQRTLLTQLQPTGNLQDVTVTDFVTPGAPKNMVANYDIATEFDNVSWQHWQKIPGVSHFSGVVHLDATSGSLVLDTTDSVWNFGHLFQSTLPIDRLNGVVTWQKNNAGWQIKGKDIIAQNEQVGTQGEFNLLLPSNHSSPIMDLTASFNLEEPVPALRYLPQDVIPPKVIHWINKSIIAAKSASGNVVLSGPLHAFPFRHQEGRFLVDSEIKDLDLYYHDGWPTIEDINGELIFENAGMTMKATSGKIYQTQLQNTVATIPDFHTSILQVQGNAQGNLSDALQFLQKSPLNDSIGSKLAGFNLQGPMVLNLKLTVPLKINGGTVVNGNLVTSKADLKMPNLWNLEAKNIQGNLQFTTDTLAGKLNGLFLNQPLNVNIKTVPINRKDNLIQFDLGNGQMTVKQLEQQFALPNIPYVNGAFNYRALLQFSTGVNPINQLIVNSDLQGVNVNLPQPLNKPANMAIPSNLQLNFGGNQTQWLINYGKRLSAALTFRKNAAGQFNLWGGEVSLGGKTAALTTQAGLAINGYLANFNWADWQNILNNLSPKNKGVANQKPNSLLRSIDIKFGQLKIYNWQLSQTELQLKPLANAWQVAINSQMALGNLMVPYNFPKGVLTATFGHLYLPAPDKKSSFNLQPSSIPALDFSCQDFRFGEKNIGAVTLKATPFANTLRIDQVTARSNDLNFRASGNWQMFNKAQRTDLNGQLTTGSLGSLLKNWNITQSVVGASGASSFSLNWSGPPYQPNLGSLGGSIKLNFNNGRIINLSRSTESELGLGRVLNLFSLQTLPRRLRGDFSDLTDAGFSFDIMQGDFNLQRGSANTRNAFLDGPVAKVSLRGRIGLASQDYDLILYVSPYLTSNLPLVATVAGGPIAGAITWIASKVLNPAVSQLTTYTYKVTGSWSNPTIAKLTGPQANS